MRGGPPAVAAGLLLAGLAGIAAGPAAADPPFPDPGRSTLSASVTRFTLDGSVTRFRLDGGVTSLTTDTTSGGRRTLSVSSDVLFAFGSATLAPAATAVLAKLVASVPQGAAVTLAGYTDSIGTPSANLALSRRRADAVKAALARSRPDLRTTATGYGEADPVAPNTVGGQDNPAGRAQNRRVTLAYPKAG